MCVCVCVCIACVLTDAEAEKKTVVVRHGTTLEVPLEKSVLLPFSLLVVPVWRRRGHLSVVTPPPLFHTHAI